MISQIKDRKHTEQNFHSVARVMPRGGTCGCWGESKTLAWGFAMAPHRLRALVLYVISCSDLGLGSVDVLECGNCAILKILKMRRNETMPFVVI